MEGRRGGYRHSYRRSFIQGGRGEGGGKSRTGQENNLGEYVIDFESETFFVYPTLEGKRISVAALAL